MDLDLGQLRALEATVRTGSLDAAARVLHVTPSAVSQRLRALEVATGRVLVVRSRPVRPTASGETLVRLARQLELLAADAAAELGHGEGSVDEGRAPRAPVLPVAVNADSLATWALPALAPLAGPVVFDLRREDQAHTSTLLRDGTVMAAVTSESRAVPGCRVTRLGVMTYRPTATPGFVRRWFPEGADTAALAVAPVVVFDRKDDLQHAYLRRRGVVADASADGRTGPPTSYVPSSADFLRAVHLGMGWGMLPDQQAAEAVAGGELVCFDPDGTAAVELHWQQWKLRSPSLDRVAEAVVAAARAALSP